MLFPCDKHGKSSLADFEEALQTSSDIDFFKPFLLGKPCPEIMMKQPNFLSATLVTHKLTGAKQPKYR